MSRFHNIERKVHERIARTVGGLSSDEAIKGPWARAQALRSLASLEEQGLVLFVPSVGWVDSESCRRRVLAWTS